LNKHYGTRVLVSEQTLNLIADRIAYRIVDRVAVKGKSKGALIAEIAVDRPAWWGDFDLARQAYEQQDWSAAIKLFDQVQQRKGSFDRVSVLLAERCRQFLLHGVPADWSGVWVMQDK
jgi:adenylate cyclase